MLVKTVFIERCPMNSKKKTLLLGAHMSVEGGFDKAIERALSIGCTTLQIFTKSNRQWYAKPLEATEIELFKKAFSASGLDSVVSHASYLINLPSATADTRTKSIKALKEEIHRCEQLGIKYLVLHPGSRGTLTEQEGLDFIIKGLNEVLHKDMTTTLLLETMAGQGTSLGSTFEQLGTVLSSITFSDKVGICLDTCHIFAAGFDFSTEALYKELLNTFDKHIGLKKLKVMHINDSKKECGSRVDRHETLGEGQIPLKAFSLLFNDEQFFDVPKILETPKESLEDDLSNIKTIKKLLTPKTKALLGLD